MEKWKCRKFLIVSDAVAGTPVDLDGESRHEQVEAKLSRRGRETLNEGEEIRSPKRNVIRVESEETQDYVREGKSTEHEEEEERTFVPSAVSVPLKLLFRCDRQCSEKDSQLLAGVNSRSVAAGIASQRILGASEKLL